VHLSSQLIPRFAGHPCGAPSASKPAHASLSRSTVRISDYVVTNQMVGENSRETPALFILKKKATGA